MTHDDWTKPDYKEPPIEEPIHKHQKKGGGKKPFVIEKRYIGPDRFIGIDVLAELYTQMRKWHIDRRYKTAKQRDIALAALRHKAAHSHTVDSWWEYRIGE
jgi:hypothetical protein